MRISKNRYTNDYLEKERREESPKLIVGARCGNLKEANKYWLKMGKKMRTMSGRGDNHKTCSITREPVQIEDIVSKRINENVEGWIKNKKSIQVADEDINREKYKREKIFRELRKDKEKGKKEKDIEKISNVKT